MGIEDRKAREFRRREEEILAAAAALAGTEDWQSVTIDDIAEKAEIGKGTVYKHFHSKDEVCARLVMDDGREMLARLRAIDPRMEYVPRFKEVLRACWHHHRSRPELAGLRMYCELAPDSLNLTPQFAETFWSVRDEIVSEMGKLAREGVERGIIADQRLDYVMAAGWATLTGAMRLVAGKFQHLDDDPAFLEYMLDFILKGAMNAQATARAE